ncbi:MAG TPA: cupin domain-containing protein [Burkholderiaceae bacterium]|nr:cupin domain-containing protein [Burkholderiaceae bacterium]
MSRFESVLASTARVVLRASRHGALLAGLLAASVHAQPALSIKPLAERTVTELPTGELYWRIENLATLEQASAAAGPWSLVAQAEGKTWLFTLGPRGGKSAGATPVTEVGPIPRIEGKRWLLRINDASGPPGAVTPVHSHPGSEAFFVLDGEQSIRGLHDTTRVPAGQTAPGHGADEAMQVSSTGAAGLHALVMFVVDADRPFSTPAALPASEAH